MKWNTDEIRKILAEEGESDANRIFFLLRKRHCPEEFLSKYATQDYALTLWDNKKKAHKARSIALQHSGLPREDMEGLMRYCLSDYSNLDRVRPFFRNKTILTSDIQELLDKASTKEEHSTVLRLTAGNPRFPIELYESCATHESPYVRSSIAANRAIGDSVIETLLKDSNHRVLDNIVYNRTVSSIKVAKLLDAERNPELFPPYLIATIINRLPDGDEFDKALELILINNPGAGTKQLIAGISRDPEVLKKLATDDNVMVRELVIKNLNTPAEAKVVAALLGTPINVSKRGGLRPRRVIL